MPGIARGVQWVRDRSLGLFFLALFLVTWVAQLGVEWLQFRAEQREHGEPAAFLSLDFLVTFGQSTLENWQSEFLQIGSFVIAAAYFVYKGSSESRDGDERIEAKIDALLEARGIAPSQAEADLPEDVRSTSD